MVHFISKNEGKSMVLADDVERVELRLLVEWVIEDHLKSIIYLEGILMIYILRIQKKEM